MIKLSKEHFRERLHALPGATWRVVKIPIFLLGFWLITTVLAHSMGRAIYEGKGEPNTHTKRNAASASQRALSALAAGTNSEFIGFLIMDQKIRGLDRAFGLNGPNQGNRQPWDVVSEGFRSNNAGNVTVVFDAKTERLLQSGRTPRILKDVTHYTLTIQDVNLSYSNSFTSSMLRSIGKAQAVAGVSRKAPFVETAVWKTQRRKILYTMEWIPQRADLWTIRITATSPASPRYEERLTTGGLPFWHPHADEIAAQLSDESKLPEKPIRIQATAANTPVAANFEKDLLNLYFK